MSQLTPQVTALNHHPTPLLTCFSTSVAENCPVLVFDVQLPPMHLTRAFYFGWRRIKIARPTRVLN